MFIFAVDTEQYAGNFERPMCAYMTGQTGECGVGLELAELFEEEVDLDENLFDLMIEQVPDDHGCHRPCSIYPTPGWFNHGLGKHYRDNPEAEEQAKEDHQKQCEEKIAEGKELTFWEPLRDKPLEKHPAHLSVAIYFNRRPPDLLIELMKNRAQQFVLRLQTEDEEWHRKNRLWMKDHKITITGFRLLETTETTKELEI
jgi:hypothetical protein